MRVASVARQVSVMHVASVMLKRLRLQDLSKGVMLLALLRKGLVFLGHLLRYRHVLLAVRVPVSRCARVQPSRFDVTTGREGGQETCAWIFCWRRSASSCACCCLSNALYCTHTHTLSGLLLACKWIAGLTYCTQALSPCLNPKH
jgi:hypothetical protein